MNPQQWPQLKELFHEATELAPEARASFLRTRCGGDEEMLRELMLLLESHDEAGHFIEQPALASASEILSTGGKDFWAGKKIGRYSVLGEVGRGGMGVVLRAVRADDQFTKQVAIKLLQRGYETEDLLRRFRNERQILASLEHPNIARLLDGGMTEDGLPYIVMEYVEGEPLDRYCDRRGLSVNERLELFRTACAAVQYAHQNLIIHRDLKPSNILVTESGELKLLDFGIAKLLNPELAPQTDAPTATVARLMTPEYASPEQVRGQRVTTASDVYSLGVILYELLTGRRPYRLKDTSPEEMLRVVCDSEPARPSEAAGRRPRGGAEPSGDGRGMTGRGPAARPGSKIQSTKSLRGDLDNIVLMALRKEPARRYKSVEQFSEDIRRYLEGRPVIARKDTFAYRAAKFVGRNRVAVSAAALVVLAVVTGLIVALWQAGNARRQRDLAQHERVKAERINQFLSAALAYSSPAAALAGARNRRDATINEMLDEFAPRIETELADQPDVRASLQRTVGLAYFTQARLAEAERYLNAALETHVKLYGEDHQETAVTYAGLASVAEAKGDLAAAGNLLQKTIATYRSHPPTEQTHIRAFAGVLNGLGDVSWTKGDFDAAESAYSESLALAPKMQSSDRELIANAKRGLGITRYAQGRLDEAATLLREAVGEYRNLPHLRWRLPDALNFLAQTLTWKSQLGEKSALDEALTYLKESEAVSLEVWGENNFWYPRSLWLQVYAMCFKGECAAAEAILNKAEEVNRRYFPDNKVTKANLYDARNIILTGTGRAAEGETFGRQSVALYQASTNRGTPSITLARVHVAENLTAQKKYDEAERVLLEAYKDASEVQGAGHWRTKTAAAALVKLYEAWDKPDLAAEYRALAP